MRHKGMIHIHLAVSDLERSIRFYEEAFGLKVIFAEPKHRMAFLQTPGTSEVVTLRQSEADHVGQQGGLDHFGFPLEDPATLEEAIREVEAAGGRLIEREELAGGYPSAFVADPDGYRIQI